jgi:pectinesterase
VAEAVASAPNKGKTRYVIYVKNGTYEEKVDISSQKTNVMLVGDGADATIITGSLNVVDGTGTFQSATVGLDFSLCLYLLFTFSIFL